MSQTLRAQPTRALGNPPVPGRHAARRPDIQGLRAVAVVVVIADHVFGWPDGGFLGVDVFFVISGFLITGLLLREHERTGRISFVDFYRRRARRIVPVATLVLLATVAAAQLLLPADRAASAATDGLFAVVFAVNWRLAAVGTDYFQATLPPSPLQHYWSLSVEEQFYLVIPWALLGALALAARAGWGPTARRRLVRLLLVTVTGASFGWAAYATTADPASAYFSTFTRAWELGVGAVLAACAGLLQRFRAPRLRPVLAWLGLAGILASLVLVDAMTAVPAPGALLPVLATALVIAAGTGPVPAGYHRAVGLLTNRVAGYLGDLSFSLYLWHFPVAVLALAVLPAGSVLYGAAVLALTAALSSLSYRWIEVPVRSSRWLERTSPAGQARPADLERAPGLLRVLAVGASVAVLAGAAVVAVQSSPPAGPVAVTGAKTGCVGADFLAPSHSPACRTDDIASEPLPSVDRLAADVGDAYACYRDKGRTLSVCHFGPAPERSLRVALVGDSHAAMLLPAIVPELQRLGWSLDTYVGYGCQWKEPYAGDCAEDLARTKAALTGDRPYDLVITTGARWVDTDTGAGVTAAADAYATAWRAATTRGTRVVVVGDSPGVSAAELACVARITFDAAADPCGAPRSTALAQVDPLLAAARAVPDVTVVDPTDLYCTATSCPAVIGGVIVYRDTAAHVTNTYMTTLRPYLMARIERAAG